MHPTAIAAALLLAPAAQAACPVPRAWTERFVAADCTDCWRERAPQPAGLAIDWIVPAAPDAPLAPAALAEANQRPGTGALRTQRLKAPSGYTLAVQDGIPLQGYIGVSLSVRTTQRAVPAGLVGYIALVEQLAAGEEGSDGPRLLVRSLIGPLALADLKRGSPSTHRLATRVPETPRVDRLGSVGWIQTAQGEVLAATAACGRPR